MYLDHDRESCDRAARVERTRLDPLDAERREALLQLEQGSAVQARATGHPYLDRSSEASVS